MVPKEERFCIDATDTNWVEDDMGVEEEDKEAVDAKLGLFTDRALVTEEEEEEEEEEMEGDCLLVEAEAAPAELANEE